VSREEAPARACPHSPRPHRICEHLLFPLPLEGGADADYRLVFEGPEYVPMCSPCALESATPALVACCDDCRRPYLRTESFGTFDGFRGTPTPRVRDAGLSLVVESVDVRGELRDRVLQMAPVARSGRSLWILWTASRRLVTIELPSGRILSRSEPLSLERLPEPEVREHRAPPTVSLQVSLDGRFAALLLEQTRHGVIVETATGGAIAMLDRGTYHPEASRWPFAFYEREGRTLAVHAVDWNCIGVMDVETGTPVTPSETDEQGPDYFLGTLTVSPGGRWLAMAGWVWHPVGALRVFRLDLFLEGKRKEEIRSKWLNQTDHWDAPNVWLDDERLLAWGLGNSDRNMVDAGVLFDAEADTIAGLWPALPCSSLFIDRSAGLVYAGGSSTSVWDAATGERLVDAPDLVTHGFHPSARHTAGVVDPEGRFAIGFLQKRRSV
jgi:hypothetical protein